MTGARLDLPRHETMSFAELRAGGASRAGIRDAIREGLLVRARRDVYLSGDVPTAVVAAQRVGGRLDCLSAVAAAGVFVRDRGSLHVQVEPHRSRLRSPESRRIRLSCGERVVVHWREGRHGAAHTVPIVEALASAVRCQEPRAAVATLDSALFTATIDADEVGEIFAFLPRRYRALRPLLDGRAEAGSESLARLLLRGLGFEVEVQVWIAGVGRVDLLVDGWIVVECDSRAHHGGWEAQERDRCRDLLLARRGYAVLRPTANMIFTEPELLLRAVRGLLDQGQRR